MKWSCSSTALLLSIVALISVSSLLLPSAHGFHASGQCVQLGQGNMNTKAGAAKTNAYDFYYRYGYWTIGTRKFDTKFSFLDYSYGQSSSPTSYPPFVDYTGFDKNGVYRRKKRQTPPSYLDFFEHPTATTRCPYEWREKKIGTSFYHHPSVDLCPANVEIRTYAVKEVVDSIGYSRVLNGWLYVEIELMDKNDEILAIYIQMRDEYFNAIGEFVGDPSEQCPNPDPSKSKVFGQPTAYQILPCSSVGYRESKVSNAIFMARKQMLKYPANTNVNWTGVLPPDDQPKEGVRFTWRLQEYWCNRHLRFRPEAIIFTKKMAFKNQLFFPPFIMRKAANYWITHKWYGAADVKRENTQLKCDQQAINYTDGSLTTTKDKNGNIVLVAPWLLNKSVESILENDYMFIEQWDLPIVTQVWQLKSCMANIRDVDPSFTPDGVADHQTANDSIPSFAGRCPDQYGKEPRHESLQGCETDPKKPEFEDLLRQYPNISTYKEFMEELHVNRTLLCSVPCLPPDKNNKTHLKTILDFTDNSGESNYTKISRYNSRSREQNRVEQLYVSGWKSAPRKLRKPKNEWKSVGRKYHAALSIVWTMFLMPVGIFIARYLKETCMNVTCTGAHLWFWVHCVTALFASSLIVSGLLGMHHSLKTWGRNMNKAGVAHRIIGYLSAVLFMLLVIFGGFRGLQRQMRFATMTVHSVLGFSIYILNIAAMLISAFIPASPSMGDNCDNDGIPTDVGSVVIVICIWIGIDAVLHIVMNVLQCMVDAKYNIQRPWFCPIIPLMPHNSTKDMKGSFVRKLTMVTYAATAFVMTNTTIGLVMDHTPGNKTCLELTGISDLSCAHPKYGCSDVAQAYVKDILSTKNESGHYTILDDA